MTIFRTVLLICSSKSISSRYIHKGKLSLLCVIQWLIRMQRSKSMQQSSFLNKNDGKRSHNRQPYIKQFKSTANTSRLLVQIGNTTQRKDNNKILTQPRKLSFRLSRISRTSRLSLRIKVATHSNTQELQQQPHWLTILSVA